MIDSDLTHLQPWVSQRAQAWLEMALTQVLPLSYPGYTARITETLRDASRQATLPSTGFSGVTVGFHNFGRAFDFAVSDEHGVLVTDGSHPVYRTLGTLGECLGLYWGGRFQQWVTQPDGTKTLKPKPDYDHLEDRSHGTVAELEARQAAGLDT
jgi:hypothetical protein